MRTKSRAIASRVNKTRSCELCSFEPLMRRTQQQQNSNMSIRASFVVSWISFLAVNPTFPVELSTVHLLYCSTVVSSASLSAQGACVSWRPPSRCMFTVARHVLRVTLSDVCSAYRPLSAQPPAWRESKLITPESGKWWTVTLHYARNCMLCYFMLGKISQLLLNTLFKTLYVVHVFNYMYL